YRHFNSRTALTLEAFEYAVSRMRDRFLRAAQNKATPTETLLAFLNVFREAAHDEAFHGSCPIINLAVESEHPHPPLPTAARQSRAPPRGAQGNDAARWSLRARHRARRATARISEGGRACPRQGDRGDAGRGFATRKSL